MDISYKFLQILVLAVTAVVFTASMTCDKMILSDSAAVNNGATNYVFEMSRYRVRTTRRIASNPVRDLVSTLHGASEIQVKRKSFTAVLQPRDLKKVIILATNGYKCILTYDLCLLAMHMYL